MDDLISRQAVTKFLNDWLSCLFENCHKQSASDLKMIIKDFKNLPSAQPETNCSEIPNSSDTISRQLLSTNLAEVGTDCISRQAVFDALRNYLVGKNVPCDGTLTCRLIENEVINKLPSAQPKRGKWIKTARWGRVYYCDQCRNYLDFDGVNAGRGSTNFCPNCGAKMEGTT